MSSFRSRICFAALAVVALAGGAAGCTSDEEKGQSAADVTCEPAETPAAVTADAVEAADTDGVKLKLTTHGSFTPSEGIFDSFTEETGIEVEVVPFDDAGTLVSQAVLTAGNPTGDVMFGIDNTFLCRGTEAGVFVPYEAAALDSVDESLKLAPSHLLTPMDTGDVCLNYSRSAFPDGAPERLEDLTEAAFENAFVTQNPETSSPGMAMLLATVAHFGEDGWEQYWEDLRENGVKVTSGWTEAYEDDFGSGSGDRSVVTSYASSPVADVVYSDPPRDSSNVGVVADACFRQIEYAGILRGTEHPEAAAKLVDFMLSPTFQEDIPLSMFVAPANSEAEVPEEFAAHSVEVDEPITMTPEEIEAGRDGWTEQWTEIVLR